MRQRISFMESRKDEISTHPYDLTKTHMSVGISLNKVIPITC